MKPVRWLTLLAFVALLAAIFFWHSQLLPLPPAGRGPVLVLHNTMRPSHGSKSVRPVGGHPLPVSVR